MAKALGLKPYDHYEIVVRPDGRWHVYFKQWTGWGHSTKLIDYGLDPNPDECENQARDAAALHREQREWRERRQQEFRSKTRTVYTDGRK